MEINDKVIVINNDSMFCKIGTEVIITDINKSRGYACYTIKFYTEKYGFIVQDCKRSDIQKI